MIQGINLISKPKKKKIFQYSEYKAFTCTLCGGCNQHKNGKLFTLAQKALACVCDEHKVRILKRPLMNALR